MPTKRQRRTHTAHSRTSDFAWALLMEQSLDGLHSSLEDFSFQYPTVHPEASRHVWEIARDEVLAEWVREKPGTRPGYWWLFDAPRGSDECLLSIGIDRTSHEFTAQPRLVFEPRMRIGSDGQAYLEAKRGDYEHHGLPDIDRDKHGVAIIELGPWRYESEATYLQRHSLFLPGERRRLFNEDFEPEVIEFEETSEETQYSTTTKGNQ